MDDAENLLGNNAGLEDNDEMIRKYGSLNKQDPYSSSGFFGRLFVSWAYNIVKLSNYVSLKPKYFGHLSKNLQSQIFSKYLCDGSTIPE